MGNALSTRDVLEMTAAHAGARDAVHIPLDIETLAAEIRDVGIGEPTIVRSRAASRQEYLRRPDLGRLLASPSSVPVSGADIGIVLADGLSPTALMHHGPNLLRELVAQLRNTYTLAPPVIATQARVALGDRIATHGRFATSVVIIGERPGLTFVDSLGIYLTHLPSLEATDAERNCISNIHPPDGIDYREAASIATHLLARARQLGRTGVSLKDTSRDSATDALEHVGSRPVPLQPSSSTLSRP